MTISVVPPVCDTIQVVVECSQAHELCRDISTIRNGSAPEKLLLHQKIILNIFCLEILRRMMLSPYKGRKRTDWDDDPRTQLIGLGQL